MDSLVGASEPTTPGPEFITVMVMNCNTSLSMTESIARTARAAARPRTRILAAQPEWGPTSVQGFYESYLSAAAVIQALASWQGERFDAVVMAGFGEHGREGARQVLEVPVVDITEAACALACLVGYRFGIVTTAPEAVAQIEQSILTAGVDSRCASIRPTGLGVLELEGDWERCASVIVTEASAALDAGADVLVLGCAGMSGYRDHLSAKLGVPVIDGVAAAVALCESLVGLGLRTSKHGPFSRPRL